LQALILAQFLIVPLALIGTGMDPVTVLMVAPIDTETAYPRPFRARLLVEQAEALGEPPDDPLILFSALYAFWNAVPFNGDVCRAVFGSGCETTDDGSAANRTSHHGAHLVLYWRIVEAKAHFDNGLALYNAVEHRPLATRFWVDSRIVILCWRSLAAWALGYPAAAISDSDQPSAMRATSAKRAL
jgi:hypothetical protein